MVESGFELIGTHVKRSQNTFAQYIATQSILDLCEWSAQRTGARVSRWWWEQEYLYLEGGKKRAAAKSYVEEAIGKEEGILLETKTGQE